MRNAHPRLALAALPFALGACQSTPDTNQPPPAPTYYHDVKPILDARCTSCHTAGGIAPFALGTYEDAAPRAALIRDAVANRVMPPWPPSAACNHYEGDRSLTDAQIRTITDWVDGNTPEGDPADTGAPLDPPTGGLSRVDLTLQPAADYTPVIAPDEYRCFLIDWNETTRKYVTGFRAQPGQPGIVHHAIAYVALPSQVSQYEALDAQDAAQGWSCFGGPGLTGARPVWMGAWTPGSQGQDFPEGTGLPIEPGSKIVLQVHYNLSSNPPSADRTSIALRLEDNVQTPAAVIPFANIAWATQHTMDIPAGEADVTHRFAADVTQFLPTLTGNTVPAGAFRVWSAGVHLHTRGKRGLLEVVHASGTHECVLDLPDWDFHWQGTYRLAQPVTISPGDQLAVECHWDNTAANQPIVNGQPEAPHDLNWGEGTEDEMCLGMLYVSP